MRPLYDDGASSATAATRDYVLSLDDSDGAPLLNVFGGKITTYRRLAEAALDKLGVPAAPGPRARRCPAAISPGTAPRRSPQALMADYPFLDRAWARAAGAAYGTEARDLLGDGEDRGRPGPRFRRDADRGRGAWHRDRNSPAPPRTCSGGAPSSG